MQFPTLAQLKDRRTRKWTVYGEDILPLWIAESDFFTCTPVKQAIMDAIDRESFGYTPATSELPEAVADFYAERYGWRPDPAMIVATPDVVRGLALAIEYMTRPDSAVVVPVPAYPPFLELPETVGREMVFIDAYGGLDLTEIEQAFADGAGSILLCSPNNPLGYTLDEDFLVALCELADRYDARVLVDEIHAPLVFDGRHIVAAGLNDTAAKVCVTVTATSKAWNIAGLKCAQIIFTNPEDLATWNKMTGVAKDGVSTIGIWAAIACYREGGDFLDRQIDYLRANRDWLVAEVPKRVPGLKVTNPAATYLMWLDFSGTAIGDLERPAIWLRENAKVAFNDGLHFGPGGLHHARLNFGTSREILEEACARLEKAFAAL
ncbi:aminotransferase class I/II-fold pyridoxal phosphate-dependent enzyme [Corynebacterium hylobatis]|uniref:cysteine-S-conjugate beta-lyase n=1 Tax=Corynebacterium hylobatis TaxID=1859290 RepID=A0A430HWY9_9CORY|nr:aminotransferase class I/II-fold pyridoxal phosphate-dependent enzyme [Corynebacterium hylobatis]RSZ62398.1 aminotransferase class I/II-fold pyridoxal phosphate-dependent enzyme [Corynebacterium hylobatis]